MSSVRAMGWRSSIASGRLIRASPKWSVVFKTAGSPVGSPVGAKHAQRSIFVPAPFRSGDAITYGRLTFVDFKLIHGWIRGVTGSNNRAITAVLLALAFLAYLVVRIINAMFDDVLTATAKPLLSALVELLESKYIPGITLAVTVVIVIMLVCLERKVRPLLERPLVDQPAQPNVVPVTGRTFPAIFDGKSIEIFHDHMNNEPRHDNAYLAAVVQITNRPTGTPIGEASEVHAAIEYIPSEGPSVLIHGGVWMNLPVNKIHIPQNAIRELVLCLKPLKGLSPKGPPFTIQDYREAQFKPQYFEKFTIDQPSYRVEITLAVSGVVQRPITGILDVENVKFTLTS